jgi:probable HAF family extracellular repeat protein
MRYTAAVRGRTAKQQSDNVRAAAGLALFLTLAVVLASCREGAFQPSSTPSDLTIDRPSAAPGPNLVVSKVVATDLGTLPGGASSAAFDVNDQGQIVGEGTTASGATHAFIMTGGTMTDLGTLPGGDYSSARGINNNGQVVGVARTVLPVYPPGVMHGFEWENGAMRDLGAFPPEDNIGSSSGARGISDAGLIAGNVDLAGVVWDLHGTPKFPPFPPTVRVTDPGPFTPARANDVNNAGQAIGKLLSQAVAFRWQGGVLQPLAVLAQRDDEALRINQAGAAVGSALLAPPVRHHAVLWQSPATVQDLGTLGGANSAAFDLNDNGSIVGTSETASGNSLAFLWRSDLGMQSLGTLGGASSAALGVNNSGQIVGVSDTRSGERHATLWTVRFACRRRIRDDQGHESQPRHSQERGADAGQGGRDRHAVGGNDQDSAAEPCASCEHDPHKHRQGRLGPHCRDTDDAEGQGGERGSGQHPPLP